MKMPNLRRKKYAGLKSGAERKAEFEGPWSSEPSFPSLAQTVNKQVLEIDSPHHQKADRSMLTNIS